MYNEPYSLSDPPSDQFPFFRRDKDEEREDAAAEPTQGRTPLCLVNDLRVLKYPRSFGVSQMKLG